MILSGVILKAKWKELATSTVRPFLNVDGDADKNDSFICFYAMMKGIDTIDDGPVAIHAQRQMLKFLEKLEEANSALENALVIQNLTLNHVSKEDDLS